MLSKPREITIYAINCGPETYVGSTNNYKSRIAQHRRDLHLGIHHNYKLQNAYLTSKLDSVKILDMFRTRFNYKRFRVEQRYINKYATCNLANASSNSRYTWKEFFIDIFERIF